MIIFHSVKFKNFLSSGNNPTTIQLDGDRTTLVVGQNGAGKSTMLDAISFGLFGKAHRKIAKPQLINSINNKHCVVEIEFSIGKNEYRVLRGIKPNKFEIYSNGKLMNQDSHNKEHQKILEQNILKLNHKTFHQVVVLGSSSFTPFMQLPTAHRREVIEDLLDINVFSKMNMLLKEKNSALKEQIRQVNHGIELNQTKINAQKKYIRDISKINNDAKAQKELVISESRKDIESITKLNHGEQARANSLQLEYNPQLQLLREKITQLNAYESEFNTKIRKLVKDAQFYEKNENCPTCEQVIDEELKKIKLTEAQENASELQNGLSRVQEERNSATENLTTVEKKMEEVGEILQNVQINLTKINSLNQLIEASQKEIESLSDVHSDLSKANDDYEALNVEHHSLMADRAKHNDQYAYNAVIAEMLKDSGIKTKIIKQYLPVINKLVNQYLTVLDFYVLFEMDESFSESIRSRHRDVFTYDSFSEGEKQRIDLALLFTWRQVAKMKNSISTNLLLLDETFDSSLDESGIENLMKIIYTLGDDTNIFIISHKGELLEGKFENKLTFVKEKNFSHMRVAA